MLDASLQELHQLVRFLGNIEEHGSLDRARISTNDAGPNALTRDSRAAFGSARR
jgi:hypothetical protein